MSHYFIIGQTLVAQGGGDAPGGILGMLLPFALVFLVFWFLVIRPQQKQYQQHQEFLKGLKTGDDVVTDGGIFGKVASIDETTVTIEVARGTKIKVLRSKIESSQKAAVSEEKTEEKSDQADTDEKDED